MDTPTPPKYIRTFEGDMETLKKGGAPELVPLEKPLSAGVASRRDTPLPPDAGPLKTYAGDFSERMKETHASAATVLAAEQDASPRTPQVVSGNSSQSNLPYIIAGILLLVAGGFGAYVAYTRYQAVSAPVVLTQNASAPIFVDESEQISGTGTVLLKAIEQSVARPLAPNTIRLLSVASTTAGSVFSALPLSAPDILLRNVNAAGSMAGVAHAGDSQGPFFILSVDSYGETFAGMFSWEPRMPRDLKALFPPYPQSSAGTTTAATSTPSTQPEFRDEVVSNHDVRIYRDAAGRSVLLYGYWNQTTLIIARDQEAFAEILERLGAARTQR
mgnify:FL=1